MTEEFPASFGIEALSTTLKQLAAEVKAGRLVLERISSKMPTRADFDAAKQALAQAIADAGQRVSTDIQALRDAIANGNPVTDQDLADLQADVLALASIDPAVVPPPPGTRQKSRL